MHALNLNYESILHLMSVARIAYTTALQNMTQKTHYFTSVFFIVEVKQQHNMKNKYSINKTIAQ